MNTSKSSSLVVAVLLTLGLVAAPGDGAIDCQLSTVGKLATPAAALGVALQGTTLFVASASDGLVTFDVGTVASFVQLGSLDTAGTASDVAVSSGRAYVADGDAGLAVVDVSDPASPTLLGTAGTPDFAAGVAVDPIRKVAFVAAKSAGIRVFDVSKPSAPLTLGGFPTPGYARNVLLDGQILYVADWQSGLLLVDVSNKSSLRLVGAIDTLDRAVDLALGGKIVWVADYNGGVVGVDVSVPSAPVRIVTISTRVAAASVEVVGSRLFVMETTVGLVVYDISNPSAPVELDELDTRYAYDFVYGAGLGFLADYYGGVDAISIASCLASPPMPAFGFEPAAPQAGESVQFSDLSSGDPTSWAWEFGDGTTSVERNPTHAYAFPGLFEAKLTVTNEHGSASSMKPVPVGCSVPCPSAPVLVLAGAARAPGAEGTLWRSDLVLFNPSSSAMRVGLEYVPFGSTEVFVSPGYDLAPRGTLVLHDLLGSVFAVDTGSGVVRVRLPAGAAALPFAALSTFNATADGTFGQWIPAVVDAGTGASGGSRWLAGLRNDASFRTNLGVANLGAETLSVSVQPLGPAGALLGAPIPLALAAGEARQLPLVGGGLDGAGLFSVRIERISGGAFLSWASRIDNRSGDPTFVADSLASISGPVLPGVASTAGAAGTRWKSRLVAANPGDVHASARLLFHPAGEPAAWRSAPLEVPSHGSVEVGDCLRELFGSASDEWGWVEIAANASGAPLPALYAETWNDTSDGGFGQTIAPLAPDASVSMAGPAASLLGLPGVERSASFRTNLGLVNLGSVAATVRVELLGEDGTVAGTRELEIPAGDACQGDLFDGTGIVGDFSVGTALVRPLSGGPAVAYASRVDNRTGDPTFLSPVTVRP